MPFLLLNMYFYHLPSRIHMLPLRLLHWVFLFSAPSLHWCALGLSHGPFFLCSLSILICRSYPFSWFKCQLYVSDSKISNSSSDLSAELPVCMSSYLLDISTWGLIDNIKLGMSQTVDSTPAQPPHPALPTLFFVLLMVNCVFPFGKVQNNIVVLNSSLSFKMHIQTSYYLFALSSKFILNLMNSIAINTTLARATNHFFFF